MIVNIDFFNVCVKRSQFGSVLRDFNLSCEPFVTRCQFNQGTPLDYIVQFLFPILSLVSRLRNTVAQYGAELGNNNSIALWFALCYCLMFSKS